MYFPTYHSWFINSIWPLNLSQFNIKNIEQTIPLSNIEKRRRKKSKYLKPNNLEVNHNFSSKFKM